MRKNTRPARRATATKVIASVALLAGAASVAGMGTFGAFTDTTTADQAVKAGTIGIDTRATISDPITKMVPGDTVQRAFPLTREKDSEDFGSITLTSTLGDYTGIDGTEAPKASDLPTLSIDTCDNVWTAVGTTKELQCGSGQGRALVTAEPVNGTYNLLALEKDLNANGTSYLRVTLAFPDTKEDQNYLQGSSANLKLQFDATQRAGEFR